MVQLRLQVAPLHHNKEWIKQVRRIRNGNRGRSNSARACCTCSLGMDWHLQNEVLVMIPSHIHQVEHHIIHFAVVVHKDIAIETRCWINAPQGLVRFWGNMSRQATFGLRGLQLVQLLSSAPVRPWPCHQSIRPYE